MQLGAVLELSEIEIQAIKDKFPLWVGSRIKKIRNEKGITQTKLAELTGKDRQYIYKIEKGFVTPNIATIKILTTALEVTLSTLFTENI